MARQKKAAKKKAAKKKAAKKKATSPRELFRQATKAREANDLAKASALFLRAGDFPDALEMAHEVADLMHAQDQEFAAEFEGTHAQELLELLELPQEVESDPLTDVAVRAIMKGWGYPTWTWRQRIALLRTRRERRLPVSSATWCMEGLLDRAEDGGDLHSTVGAVALFLLTRARPASVRARLRRLAVLPELGGLRPHLLDVAQGRFSRDVVGMALDEALEEPGLPTVVVEVGLAHDGCLTLNGKPVLYADGKGVPKPLTKERQFVRAIFDATAGRSTSLSARACAKLNGVLGSEGINLKANRDEATGRIEFIARHGGGTPVLRLQSDP